MEAKMIKKKLLIPAIILAVTSISGVGYAMTRNTQPEQRVENVQVEETNEVKIEPDVQDINPVQPVQADATTPAPTPEPAPDPQPRKLKVEIHLEQGGATPQEVTCMVDYVSWRMKGSRELDVLDNFNYGIAVNEYRNWKNKSLDICETTEALTQRPFPN